MTFAKYVANRFFGLAAHNNKAYVELLFWKNVGAIREMTEGYDKDGSVLSLLCLCFSRLGLQVHHSAALMTSCVSFSYMSERGRDQRGLKRRRRSCAGSMRSTVILKVCRLFAPPLSLLFESC